MKRRIRAFPDPDSLSQGVVDRWIELAEEAVAARGSFHVALAGGSTPKRAYGLLARPENATRLDWANCHVWFGDERCVPPDSAESNYRMAAEALLNPVDLPPTNVHRMEGEQEPTEAARRYAELLARELPEADGGIGRFDLVLLGIGTDGHTASLFPDSEALSIDDSPVAANYVDKLNAWRLTLTYPVLNRARHILVLAEGEGKAEIVGNVLHNPRAAAPYPIQRVFPEGDMVWYVDEAAARHIGEAS